MPPSPARPRPLRPPDPPAHQTPPHRPFALVLGGGGARGYAHVGVLRALHALGYQPSAVVGVSMGAVVGVTYGLREDWYPALMGLDTTSLPRPLQRRSDEELALRERMRQLLLYPRIARRLMAGWGAAERSSQAGEALLERLFEQRRLETARLPVVVTATDLRDGTRVLMRDGDAATAVYASVALAGVIPPRSVQGRLLADGGYADPAPVDVARELAPVVIAVALGQDQHAETVVNGYQAFLRAHEISHLRYADLRFSQADLVLKPPFTRMVPTLDFDARREVALAGVHAVRVCEERLAALLRPAPAEDAPPPRAEARIRRVLEAAARRFRS